MMKPLRTVDNSDTVKPLVATITQTLNDFNDFVIQFYHATHEL